MRKLLVPLLAFVCVSASAQTKHTFGALDTTNAWTGNNSFTRFILGAYTVSNRPSTPVINMTIIVTDGANSTDCVAGGGGTRVLCSYDGLHWQSIGGSGGGGGGTSVVIQVNGSTTSDQTTLNFINSAVFNGLTFNFSNPSGGQVQGAFSGTLGAVGGGTGIGSIPNSDYALVSTAANTWGAQQINSGSSCGDSTHAVSYDTSTHKFGCQAITASATAGGSDTQLQYNNATALGGVTKWTSNGTTTLTGIATAILDMSAGATFKVPAGAGATVAAGGMAYDTTNKNTHIFANGADAINLAIPSAPSSGNVLDTSVAAGVVLAHDSGVATANIVTAASAFTSGHIPKAAASNKTLSDGYSVQGSDPALLTSGTVSGTAATLCTDANGGATTTGCSVGTVNSAAQYGTTYYSAAGTTTTLSGLAAPTTNGFYFYGYNITSGAAVAPTASLGGVPVNPNGETTCSGSTLAYNNRASYLKCSGGSTATATLPQITGLTASNFPFVTQNLNSGNLSLTANAADKIDGSGTGGTATVLPSWASFVYQDSTSAPGNWWTVKFPTFAAFGSTCGDSTHAISFSTTTGFGCQAITATANPAGSTTQVQYNSAGSMGASAGFTFDGTSVVTLGVAGASVGGINFKNATSGTLSLVPVTGALGTPTLSLPAATDTLVGKATTDILTNKTYDTAGTGNSFKINGTAVTAVTGTGSAVLATSPTLVTPTIGVATATSINKVAITAPASSATLTIADGKTLTVNNTMTLAGTDSSTYTFPGASATMSQTIASGTSAMGTGAISSATCATVVTTSATGTATTDVISWGFNSDPHAVTGYVPLTAGMLTIIAYPSANNVNFLVCNNTASSITPGAITLNWRIVR